MNDKMSAKNAVTINIHDVPYDLYMKLPADEETKQQYRWRTLIIGHVRLTFFPASEGAPNAVFRNA